ncbi:MAG: hypothetical protein NXI24_19330 [bacterium]|nr:hypothetical protein [bacterium]
MKELYTGAVVGSGRPALQKEAGGVLFSMIVRKLGYANSNGLNWIARRTDENYRDLYREITAIMETELQMQTIPRNRVLDHALYQEGRFPLRKKFFLNTAKLPIITNAEEEELMLRSSRALGARYFVTVLADHSVSKIVAVPASVTSVLVLNIYSADSGLIYQANLEATETAEPYDRDLSLGELYAQYEPVLAAALDRNTSTLLAELRSKIAAEIRFAVERPATDPENGDAPDNDLGF